jgi:hypothetical protein
MSSTTICWTCCSSTPSQKRASWSPACRYLQVGLSEVLIPAPRPCADTGSGFRATLFVTSVRQRSAKPSRRARGPVSSMRRPCAASRPPPPCKGHASERSGFVEEPRLRPRASGRRYGPSQPATGFDLAWHPNAMGLANLFSTILDIEPRLFSADRAERLCEPPRPLPPCRSAPWRGHKFASASISAWECSHRYRHLHRAWPAT